MRTNMGTLDRGIRILIALIIAGLYFTGIISGYIALILIVFAGIFILTSLISFCPLYLPFNLSTKKKS